MHYLIVKYNKSANTILWKALFILVVSILYGLSDGFIRLAVGQSFHGNFVIEIVVFYVTTINTAFMVMAFLNFFLRFFIDVRRKTYLMEELS